MLQLFDLHPGELDWLAKHMGHDVDIHKLAYRLHTSTVEITKVGKVLAALDQGQKSIFKGKRINEIALSEGEFVILIDYLLNINILQLYAQYNLLTHN